MAKTKKNVRAKAKSVVGAIKQKAQEAQRQQNLLHKTLTPKKTATKKEKSALKHKKLLKKFAESRKERKEDKAQDKTHLLGNLNPLRDALPSLQDIYKLAKDKQKEAGEQATLIKPETPVSSKEKIRKKRKELVNVVKFMEKVVKDKRFKENPREVIANHLAKKYEKIQDEEEAML
ncbi:hypothetical protein KR018_000996 [Drosophila ironensis]|nr:hypothetical protein KR018_000996 [Drosophila ironensis]